ncbi:MAG: HD family phosphohydrolase [Ruminococcus sp.]
MISQSLIHAFDRVCKKEISLFLSCIEDLLSSEEVQRMKNYTQHGKTSTFDHCMVVAFKSFLFCRRFKLDYRSAARGGLLHDLFLYDWHDKEARGSLHGFHHPSVALKNASRVFSLSDNEKEIIKKHMWPLTFVPPKTREAYVICYFDKVCTSKEVVREWAFLLRSMLGRSRA